LNRLLGFLQAPGQYASDWMARFARAANNELSRLTAFAGEVEWNPGEIASSGTSSAAGTVTSVALALPLDDTVAVTGSPVTTTGTLTGTAVDAAADKLVGWDDSAGKKIYFTLGTGLGTSTDTLNNTGVTSVALTMANDDTVSVTGSPVTTTGTLAAGAVDAGADKFIFWDDSAGKKVYGTLAGSLSFSGTEIRDYQWLQFAISDQTTAITTGTAKFTTRFPACTVLAVRASLNTASSSGIPTVDINEAGTTILSTKLTIDANEKTSTTAATAAVISDSTIADDAEITFDIDTAGTGAKGLIVSMQVRWT
jgi:hypothetical protein